MSDNYYFSVLPSLFLCARRTADHTRIKSFDGIFAVMQFLHRYKNPPQAYRPHAPVDCASNEDVLIAYNRHPNQNNICDPCKKPTPFAVYILKRLLCSQTDPCKAHPAFYILPEKPYFCCSSLSIFIAFFLLYQTLTVKAMHKRTNRADVPLFADRHCNTPPQAIALFRLIKAGGRQYACLPLYCIMDKDNVSYILRNAATTPFPGMRTFL